MKITYENTHAMGMSSPGGCSPGGMWVLLGFKPAKGSAAEVVRGRLPSFTK